MPPFATSYIFQSTDDVERFLVQSAFSRLLTVYQRQGARALSLALARMIATIGQGVSGPSHDVTPQDCVMMEVDGANAGHDWIEPRDNNWGHRRFIVNGANPESLQGLMRLHHEYREWRTRRYVPGERITIGIMQDRHSQGDLLIRIEPGLDHRIDTGTTKCNPGSAWLLAVLPQIIRVYRHLNHHRIPFAVRMEAVVNPLEPEHLHLVAIMPRPMSRMS